MAETDNLVLIPRKDSQKRCSMKVLVSVMLGVAVVSCTVAVFYAVANSKKSGKQTLAVQSTNSKEWRLALTGRKKPYSYIDDQGNLAGFDVDFYSALCNNANEACSLVQRPGSDCGTTVDGIYIPGLPLLSGEIDACGGKGITTDRLHYFDFTDAYYKVFAHFFVKVGNPLKFDEKQVDGKKIGFLQSTYTDDSCMQKYNKSGAQMVPADGLDEALRLVDEELVDALFAPRSSIPGVERASDVDYECTLGGDGVMVQKGSEIPAWWNPTFRAMRQSGQFQKICDSSTERHGGPVNCIL